MTTKVFISLLVGWLCVFSVVIPFNHKKQDVTPVQPAPVEPVQPPKPVEPPKPTDPELIDVQVPIAKEHRQYNYSGSQCVWCSLEALARHHGIANLYDLTDKYKFATGPSYVAGVLTKRGVAFRQSYSTKQADIEFIREYVTKKGYGVGIGVYNGTHMINLVHFDEEKGIVKIIENGDRSLKIQTWTMAQFNSRFSGWAIALVPPNKETVDSERWTVAPRNAYKIHGK